MVNQLTFDELKKWESDGQSFQLIDVREIEEHEDFNIGGELIPLAEIAKNVEKLKLNQPVVFYCKRGIRSQIAIQRLSRQVETTKFYNLRDGILHLLLV